MAPPAILIGNGSWFIYTSPAITTTSLASGNVGTTYTPQTLTATGSSPVTWSITSGSLPTGLTLDGATGVISGTPTVAATSSVTFRATNPGGYNDKTLSIVIAAASNAPTITFPTSLSAGTVGTAYTNTQFTATGTDPKTWSITSGTLPTGLTFSSSGLLSGTPTASASGSVTFTATNSIGNANTTLSLTVNSGVDNSTVSRIPYITNPWLQDGRVGVPYQTAINFTGTGTADGSGGTDDIVISIDSSTPIAPLTFGAGDVTTKYQILGTPTADQTIPVKINISNKYGSSSRTFTIRTRSSSASLTGAPVAEYGPVIRLYRGSSITAVGSTLICDPAKWQLENYYVNGEYNIQREWAWYKDGAYLHSGAIHTITAGEVGSVLYCKETAYRATSTTTTSTQNSQSITVTSAAVDSTLVYPTQLSFVGAFKSPDSITLYSAGKGFAYYSTNNSLYISKDTNVAEISIPSGLSPSTTVYASLPDYSLLQAQTDPSEGGIAAAVSAGQISGGGNTEIVGLNIYSGRLVFDAGNQYASTQTVTHWSRPPNLSTTGNVIGASTVSNATYTNPRWSTGPMATIPSDKTAVNYFGSNGKVLVGWAPDSSIGLNVSGGPSVFAFSPSSITGAVSVSSNSVLAYTQSSPVDSHWFAGNFISHGFQPVYGLTSVHYGIVYPNGTNSILFIGSNGQGYCVYSDPANPPGRPWVYDPVGSGVGEHAYPWYPQIWAYDARELKTAYDAGLPSDTVKPYAIWNFDWPTTGSSPYVQGATYDSVTKRIYIAVSSASGPPTYNRTMVYVYQVTNAS
jgi:Putative Ig domain